MQEHSKLYHYLSVFELDSKRKLAMQARRFDLLSPLLKALNKSSFDVLHKQVRSFLFLVIGLSKALCVQLFICCNPVSSIL